MLQFNLYGELFDDVEPAFFVSGGMIFNRVSQCWLDKVQFENHITAMNYTLKPNELGVPSQAYMDAHSGITYETSPPTQSGPVADFNKPISEPAPTKPGQGPKPKQPSESFTVVFDGDRNLFNLFGGPESTARRLVLKYEFAGEKRLWPVVMEAGDTAKEVLDYLIKNALSDVKLIPVLGGYRLITVDPNEILDDWSVEVQEIY